MKILYLTINGCKDCPYVKYETEANNFEDAKYMYCGHNETHNEEVKLFDFHTGLKKDFTDYIHPKCPLMEFDEDYFDLLAAKIELIKMELKGEKPIPWDVAKKELEYCPYCNLKDIDYDDEPDIDGCMRHFHCNNCDHQWERFY